jgi:glycosyltransferase involved in cell wall biosynthesis
MRFTLIVPTRNRPHSLDRCLTAIAALDYPKSAFEVIVVDDGSTPPPTEILARHAAALPLRTLRREGNGPAAARNAALILAQGDLIVFTDDDCTPQPGWLQAYEHAAQLHPGGALGGRILDAPENNLFGRSSQILVSFLYGYAEATAGHKFFCSNNLAFPREPLQTLGGFDETFPMPAAEDRDLCARWRALDALYFVPEAVILHHQDLHLRTFWRQQYRYGMGAFHYWRRRQEEGQPGNRLESLRFYSHMLSFPYGRMPLLKAIATSVLLALSQFAVAAGYYQERCREGH